MPTCVKCGDEFNLYRGKPGFANECTNCGRESEDGQERLKGVMIYGHKTAGEIQILSAKAADNHLRVASRIGKKSNLGRSSRSTES